MGITERFFFFIGQIKSGGIGIELFKIASKAEHQHMIFYENNPTIGVRNQAEGRIHRMGQNSNCMYTDIIIEDTYDVRILESLKENKNVADSIMEKNKTISEWI